MTTANVNVQVPSTDKNKNLILDHQKLAAVWQDFLQEKFKATEAESKRDPYEDLGPQLVADPRPAYRRSFRACVEEIKKRETLWTR